MRPFLKKTVIFNLCCPHRLGDLGFFPFFLQYSRLGDLLQLLLWIINHLWLVFFCQMGHCVYWTISVTICKYKKDRFSVQHGAWFSWKFISDAGKYEYNANTTIIALQFVLLPLECSHLMYLNSGLLFCLLCHRGPTVQKISTPVLIVRMCHTVQTISAPVLIVRKEKLTLPLVILNARGSVINCLSFLIKINCKNWIQSDFCCLFNVGFLC